MIVIAVMRVDSGTVAAETEVVVCNCFHAQLLQDVKTNKLSDRFPFSRCYVLLA